MYLSYSERGMWRICICTRIVLEHALSPLKVSFIDMINMRDRSVICN